MFKGPNPYDEAVVKATDENLTSENWELNLDVCDRVSSDGEAGARNCVAAILKRLVHRSANVQIYSLVLADALAKNCGRDAHRELASRAFTDALRRIVSLDRNAHQVVRDKATSLVKEWATEWGKEEEGLGLMDELHQELKRKNLIRDRQEEPPPVEPSSEQLRREDEELRRALELSKIDQGGRSAWQSHPSETPNAGSSASASASASRPSNPAAPDATGYVPAASRSDKALPSNPTQRQASTLSTSSVSPGGATASSPAAAATPSSAAKPSTSGRPPGRVRALFDFHPSEEGELRFSRGDVIRVLESVYEHWWRGELRGEAGIFPVNYVEVLPDPTPADLAKEAEMEARIFASAADIDRLLSKLRMLDPYQDNLAEDEDLQELYQNCLSLRPRIVRLIDRYSVKVAELRSMNEKFVRAREAFDSLMEQSLGKYQPEARVGDYTGLRAEFVRQPGGGPGGGGGGGAAYATQQPQQQPPPPAGQAYAATAQAQLQAATPFASQGGWDAPSPAPSDHQAAWPGAYQQQQQQHQPQPPPTAAASMVPPAAAAAPPAASGSTSAGAPHASHPDPSDPGYAQWYYSPEGQAAVAAAQAAQAAAAQSHQQQPQQQASAYQQQQQPPHTPNHAQQAAAASAYPM